MIALDGYGGGSGEVDLNGIYNQIADVSGKVSSVSGSVNNLNNNVSLLNSSVSLLSQSISTISGGGAYWVDSTFGNIAYNMSGSVSDFKFVSGKDLTYKSNTTDLYGASLSGVGPCLFRNNNLNIPSSSKVYTYRSGGAMSSTNLSVYNEMNVDGFSMFSNTLSNGDHKIKAAEFLDNSVSNGFIRADVGACINNTLKGCYTMDLNCLLNMSNSFSSVNGAKVGAMTQKYNTFSSITNLELTGKSFCNNLLSTCSFIDVSGFSNSFNTVSNVQFLNAKHYVYSTNTHRTCGMANVEASSITACRFDGDKNDTFNAQYFFKNTVSGVLNVNARAGIDIVSNTFTNDLARGYMTAFAGSRFNNNIINCSNGTVYITAPTVSTNSFSAAKEMKIECKTCVGNWFWSVTNLYANHAPNNLTNTSISLGVSNLFVDYNDDIYDTDLKLNSNITFPESKLYVRGINLVPYVRPCLTLSSLSSLESLTSLTNSVNPEFRFNQIYDSLLRFTLFPPSDLDTDMFKRTFKHNPYYSDSARTVFPYCMDAMWIVKSSSEPPPPPAVLEHYSYSISFLNYIPTLGVVTYNPLKFRFLTSDGSGPKTDKCMNKTFYHYDIYSGCTENWTNGNTVKLAYNHYGTLTTITLNCTPTTATSINGYGLLGTTLLTMAI